MCKIQTLYNCIGYNGKYIHFLGIFVQKTSNPTYNEHIYMKSYLLQGQLQEVTSVYSHTMPAYETPVFLDIDDHAHKLDISLAVLLVLTVIVTEHIYEHIYIQELI